MTRAPISDRTPPCFTRRTACWASVLLISAIMTIFGIAPFLFGGLAEESRLPQSQVALAITMQALIMGGVNLYADVFLKRRRQRLTLTLCVAALVPLQLCYLALHDTGALILCAISGVPLGLILWVAMGVIARSPTPARPMAWSQVLILSCRLALNAVLAAFFLPQWGIDAAFVAVSIVALLTASAIVMMPDDLPDDPLDKALTSSIFSAMGWTVLVAAILLWIGTMTLVTYLPLLASDAGVDAQAVKSSFVALMIGQIMGGLLAGAICTRLPHAVALAISLPLAIISLALFPVASTPAQFLTVTTIFGVAFSFSAPFLMPLIIEADPSRRAAGRFMGAALLGFALGPLLSPNLVGPTDMIGALFLAGGLFFVASMTIFGVHHITNRRAGIPSTNDGVGRA